MTIFTPLTPLLQMYICTHMYPTYPTFANVCLYPNLPHLPHFCKCIFVPQCTPLTPLLKIYIFTPNVPHLPHFCKCIFVRRMYPTYPTFANTYLYMTYPNHPILEVPASAEQPTTLLLREFN